MRRASVQIGVFQHPALRVRPCSFGWGVFTRTALSAGTLVEVAPFLVLDLASAQHPPLRDYTFRLTDDPCSAQFDQRALVLGWGSLYNHADEPSLEYHLRAAQRLFEYITTRDIVSGEQLFVSYGPAWWTDRGRVAR
ncbi:MAG: SET domain-containing protein-lysine N-methyltransferase [Myxococcales bacterium]|nr:SET domain-containing protein-lysine N-methyltransferase [Myxococcales bacterium]